MAKSRKLIFVIIQEYFPNRCRLIRMADNIRSWIALDFLHAFENKRDGNATVNKWAEVFRVRFQILLPSPFQILLP